ncbi:MAG TPA: thermonuclease family protein [Phycisphaerae bacterium]|nr:thermonuclease family protein [Phycisphaerae bacterium]
MAALILAVLIVAASRWTFSAGPDHERYHNRQFVCVQVVDGDTIDVDAPDAGLATTRVRFWGVDTPETAKSRQGEMYFGLQASAFTKSCVDGKTVRLVLAPDQTRDKYGRLLAYVYFDEPPRMLNEEIIAGGFGYVDSRFDHVWRQRFMDVEGRARKQGLGLWAEVRPDQMPEWRQRREAYRASLTRPAAN